MIAVIDGWQAESKQDNASFTNNKQPAFITAFAWTLRLMAK
jgi:hypothetical protein